MKHLFVTRHGDYGYDDRINICGKKQMENLAYEIQKILNGGSLYLFSSTAPRALDSSEILAVQLGLPQKFEQIPYLWTGSDCPDDSYYHDSDLSKIIKLIDERKNLADGLVMVSHLEVVEEFPDYFIKKEFGQDKRFGNVPKGRAVHI